MNLISKLDERYDMFFYAFKKCGVHLLKETEEMIGYYIFEEFCIDVISFFHIDNLNYLCESN